MPSTYRLTRDLHLYAGLFLSPLVLLFAASVFLVNHPGLLANPETEPAERSTLMVAAEPALENLELARSIRDQIRDRVGATGEIGWMTRDDAQGRFSFPLEKPGELIEVRVDLRTGEAELERRSTGVRSAVVYLHKMPGPHNVAIRGNWAQTRAWRLVADATVYLLLFLTATGVYLWLAIASERRTGIIILAAGALTLSVLAAAVIG